MRKEMKKKEFNYTLIILNKGIEGEVVEIAEDISIVCNTEKLIIFSTSPITFILSKLKKVLV